MTRLSGNHIALVGVLLLGAVCLLADPVNTPGRRIVVAKITKPPRPIGVIFTERYGEDVFKSYLILEGQSTNGITVVKIERESQRALVVFDATTNWVQVGNAIQSGNTK